MQEQFLITTIMTTKRNKISEIDIVSTSNIRPIQFSRLIHSANSLTIHITLCLQYFSIVLIQQLIHV